VDHVSSVKSYLDTLFGTEDEILLAIRATIATSNLPSISVHPRLGRLLALLVRLSRAHRVLELGTLGGVSAIYMARALPPDGYLLTIEKGEEAARLAQENFTIAQVDQKIELLVGDVLEILPILTVPSFDFVFIDAEKAEYPAYLDAVLPLLRGGALLIADNTLRRGKPMHPEEGDRTAVGLGKFNQRLSSDPRLEALIIPDIGDYGWGDLDGIALAVVR
jgi:caffeoyl-CoA O-methyltransferase